MEKRWIGLEEERTGCTRSAANVCTLANGQRSGGPRRTVAVPSLTRYGTVPTPVPMTCIVFLMPWILNFKVLTMPPCEA
ncbi:hypothetical protein P3T24_001611 [Paraburkholderia sp. GAS33]|jgi:hypothetical protein